MNESVKLKFDDLGLTIPNAVPAFPAAPPRQA
jgi:hypothetical protein